MLPKKKIVPIVKLIMMVASEKYSSARIFLLSSKNCGEIKSKYVAKIKLRIM